MCTHVSEYMQGEVLSSSIDGTIQMKSYLRGSHQLTLGLSEDLVIGKSNRAYNYNKTGGNVILDDCNFHECARLDEFETNRTISFIPPDGEFNIFNYRVTNEFGYPFRIFPYFELVSPYKVEVMIKIRADIPKQNYGNNVMVELPLPANVQTVTSEFGVSDIKQTAEFDRQSRKVLWKIQKFAGGSEQEIKLTITFKEQQTDSVRKRIGPISMKFEILTYSVSKLQVRYLRVLKTAAAHDPKYNPYRWVKYIAKSQSYICRL